MTEVPRLDPDRGDLLIDEATFRVLVGYAADPITAAVSTPGAQEHLALLQSAGVIDSGGLHPALAPALAAIVGPEISRLELGHSGKVMQGWLSSAAAALLLPSDEKGLRRLIQLHPSLVPEALARLVDMGPRPRVEPAVPVRYQEGHPAAVRRRWQLSASWTLEDGTSGGTGLDVLDTDHGLWLLEPDDDGQLAAWPTTPTHMWRLIIRTVMRRDAVGAGD